MSPTGGLVQAYATQRIARHSAWKLALLAGFVTQLLLILFVTAIGLQQLRMTTDTLNQVVDVHMRKQALTQTMVVAARERTMIMLMLTRITDPFERDDLQNRFYQHGSQFAAARLALLDLPLPNRERELLARQGQLTRTAVPLQEQVIALISTEHSRDAAEIVLQQAIPAQNDVMAVLWQLASECQQAALAASRQAREDHRVARFWMVLLSGAALLGGVFVAAAVFFYATRISREREQIATHDSLTGLPNRTLFTDRLEQALIRANRQQTMVGVMFIDLDRFKRVNDTLGHTGGDQLICEVARRLRATVRAEDVVARLGGDEFVVVVSDVSALNAILHVVETMLASVSQPYRIAGREIFCSCSIGVSVYPNDGVASGDLLRHADAAMYHAKHNGRNSFQLYDAAMNLMAAERLQLETEMHYAQRRGEFVFHYQPQLDQESGHIHCVEALIRWNHPGRGLLGPEAFLNLLEETGGVVEVGRTLLLDACRQTTRWHAAGFADLRVAVNVSGKEFWHESLVENVRTALAQSGLPPQGLQIEVTEGIFMEDVDAAVDRIQALKALGIAVAVDDFGTGYSSLAHLKRFPFDALKIDRYFVRDIPHATASEALVSSILTLCKRLHMGVVAEGVENRDQLDSLRALGCQVVQGHFISRPVPAEQVIALLGRDWLHEFGRP
jgi:diguanylate cyclase (GGDEF)-like protein